MVGLAIEDIIHASQDVALSRYLSAAAFTLVVYDWLLVCKIEGQTIWLSRLSVPKFLYYMIRITTVLFLFVGTCRVWAPLIVIPMYTSFAASNWLFTLRLIALYKHRTYLVWFMHIFYVLTYASTLVAVVVSLVIYQQTADYFPVLKTCGALVFSPWYPAQFYAPAAYEFLIVVLTAYRAWYDASLLTRSSTAPFLTVLYRDGLVCFLVMFAVRSWNIWLYATQPLSGLTVGTNIFWAINTILSTRLYLNLVWLVHRPSAATTRGGGILTTMARGTHPRFAHEGTGFKTGFTGRSEMGMTELGVVTAASSIDERWKDCDEDEEEDLWWSPTPDARLGLGGQPRR